MTDARLLTLAALTVLASITLGLWAARWPLNTEDNQ